MGGAMGGGLIGQSRMTSSQHSRDDVTRSGVRREDIERSDRGYNIPGATITSSNIRMGNQFTSPAAEEKGGNSPGPSTGVRHTGEDSNRGSANLRSNFSVGVSPQPGTPAREWKKTDESGKKQE